MIDPRLLVARLTPQPATIAAVARATALADRLLQLAPMLGLDTPEDTLAVFELWLLLAERAPASVYAQGIMRAVLSLRAWPLSARVSFLRRHLVGREVKSVDNETACTLFGINEDSTT